MTQAACSAYKFKMSSFKSRLSAEQIADVAAFVYIDTQSAAVPAKTPTTTTKTSTTTTKTSTTTSKRRRPRQPPPKPRPLPDRDAAARAGASARVPAGGHDPDVGQHRRGR